MARVVQPNCRIRISTTDLLFLMQCIDRAREHEEALDKLISDPFFIDEMLDSREVFDALLEDPSLIAVSPPLYFYVLVRHALLEAGLDDRELADYVGALLAEFSITMRMRGTHDNTSPQLDYIVDMLAALHDANEETRFSLRAHIGNYSLFLAGIFPDRIRSRASRKGAPSMDYYEGMGRMSYREAGNHPCARRYRLETTLHQLSDAFPVAREALNDLSSRLVFMDDLPHQIPLS